MNKKKETIDEANMAMHNRYSQKQADDEALKLYYSNFAGDMATISHSGSDIAGYPIGSVSSFFIDHTGSPAMMAAAIAQHSKNAAENSQTSLMVRQVSKNHCIETGWRLTMVGDLRKITGDTDKQRVIANYFRHYPEAQSYAHTHGFDFYRLTLVKARIIMGFGKISWVESSALSNPSPFDEKTEAHIIEHMNEDHSDALLKYLVVNNIEIKPNAKAPVIVGVHQYGVTIRYRKRLYFIAFDQLAKDATQAREQLVAMAKKHP